MRQTWPILSSPGQDQGGICIVGLDTEYVISSCVAFRSRVRPLTHTPCLDHTSHIISHHFNHFNRYSSASGQKTRCKHRRSGCAGNWRVSRPSFGHVSEDLRTYAG